MRPGLYLLGLALAAAPAQAETLLRADATQQPAAPVSAHLHLGTPTGPGGHSITVNSQYLMRDGRPWLPVMGEFHYSRFPPEQWESELLKMKAAGVDIVSTYIIWIHHEERPGQYNFGGDRDLRRFVELCQKHGLKVILRLGPWDHAEVRWGGIPDWVVNAVPSRGNDPQYLDFVRDYWGHLAVQVKGLLFKDGGPIIGVQLENEYNLTGPGEGAAHIQKLKDMARELGFDVPLYTVTGWDGTVYPKGEVLPVFGGYPDEPWATTTGVMPPNEVYNFRFETRVAGNAGAQTAPKTRGTAVEDMATTPFLGAEFAGGLPIMYRRRPVVQPADIEAMLPVQLGSGANLYGYYMFHGGRNPQGLTELEEDDRLGAFNGLPVINYDFQAPYGEYGQPHAVLKLIRPWHHFLNAFGDRLAPMRVHRPAVEPKDRADLTTPRYAVRSLGRSGFVFLSNHVRQFAMADQKDVRFSVDLPGGTVTFPSKPVDIADGVSFVWPFNFDLDGTNLVWASAQPVTRLTDGDQVVYVFEAQNGIAPEFAFDRDVTALSGTKATIEGHVVVSEVSPSRDRAIAVGKVSIVVLPPEDARRLTVLDYAGKTRLILTDAQVFGEGVHLDLRSDKPAFDLGIWPALDRTPRANLPLALVNTTGIFQTFRAEAQAVAPKVTVEKIREAGKAPPLVIGGVAHAAIQPYPEVYGRSAAWRISVDAQAMTGVANAYLDIRYRGDVGRLFSDDTMIDDQFWYGPDWLVGLKGRDLGKPFTLTVLPLRADAPVYIDEAFRPKADQVAEVQAVTVVPEYGLKLDAQ
jgi:hypothetical protein